MKNLFLFISLFLLPFAAKSQDEVTSKINSHIRSASNLQKITKDTLAGVLSVINQKVNSLDSMNWKMGGNSGAERQEFKLGVTVPRSSSWRVERSKRIDFGFNLDSVRTSDSSTYGQMALYKTGRLDISARMNNGILSYSNISLSSREITNGGSEIGGNRFIYAQSQILNGEISGFSHRIIAKDGISQYFHGIIFAQGLNAIQTGTGAPYLSYMQEQNVGSLFIDGETGIGYMKKRNGIGIDKYNQITTSRIYTPTSTADTSGEVGEIAHDNDYVYFKTVAGWKRVFLGSF